MLVFCLLIISALSGEICSDSQDLGHVSSTTTYDVTGSIKSSQKISEWSCESISSTVQEQRAQYYKFTADEKQTIEISTCYSSTDFPTRVIVGETCYEDVASGCVGANDGDTSGVCEGHRSRLLVNVEAGKEYYIVVTGVTSNDYGTFRLTVKKYSNPNSYICTESFNVQMPSVVDGVITLDQDFIATSHGFKRGIWFKFKASQQTHYIDTCNKFTSAGTTLYLYHAPNLNKRCMSDYPVAESSSGCGNFARLGYDKFIVGDDYYVFLFFTEDSKTNPVVGNYQISFRTNGGDNYQCANAFSISKKTFSTTIDMTGITNYTSACDLSTPKTAMFFSLKGDGRRYAFHTCMTQSTGSDTTSIEVLEGSCTSCSETVSNNCGNDALATVKTIKDTMYYFRVVCSNPKCSVSIELSEIGEKDNTQCENSKELHLNKEDDVFSQFLFGDALEESTFKCEDKEISKKGGWYHLYLNEDEEKKTITYGTINYQPKEHSSYVAEFDECDTKCIKQTSGNTFSSSFVLEPEMSKYIFVTSERTKGTGDSYGIFMFYALAKENKGNSYKNAYELPVPYSGLFELNPQTFTAQCTHQQWPFSFNITGVIVKFNQISNDALTISTCGTETIANTMIELMEEKDSHNVCYATADAMKCGKGTILTSSMNGTKYGIIGFTPDVTRTNGVARLNIYNNKKEAASICTSAEVVESIPYSVYSYTSLASSSRRKCGYVADGLKGHWFKYTPKEDEKIIIKTDDVSTFATQIGVYDGCTELVGDSIPQNECIVGETTETSPVGQRGTSLKLKAKEGETYYIFVGGVSSTDSGVMRVTFEYYNEDDGLSGGQIFGIIVAVFFFVIIFICIIAFIVYLVYSIHQKKHDTSAFATF